MHFNISSLLFLVAFAVAIGLLAVFGLMVSTRRRRSGPADPPATTQPARRDQLYPGEPASLVLAPGPTVDTFAGRVSLLEWLIHLRGAEVWTEVVATFYQRAAADPLVAAYFAGIDLAGLQHHFLRALKIVAEHGVTVGLVRNLHQRHAHVRNRAGEPITGDVWDTVIGVLATVLAEHGVPPRTLVVLATALAPIRSAIVSGGAATSSGSG